MNISRNKWQTAAFVLWPLLLLGGLILLRFTWIGNAADEGSAVYQAHCANCHGGQGEGFRQLYPPLAGVYLAGSDPGRLACIIRYGAKDTLYVNEVRYDQPMPGNAALKPTEITAVINYIRSTWGNGFSLAKARSIEAGLDSCAANR